MIGENNETNGLEVNHDNGLPGFEKTVKTKKEIVETITSKRLKELKGSMKLKTFSALIGINASTLVNYLKGRDMPLRKLKEQHPKYHKMCMKLGYKEALQYLNIFH